VGLIGETKLCRETYEGAFPLCEPFERLAHAKTVAVVGQRKTGMSPERSAEMLRGHSHVGCEGWERRCHTRRQCLADPVDRPTTLERDARSSRGPVQVPRTSLEGFDEDP
jgi:hypothetical protein